jgi:hypothetical protein
VVTPIAQIRASIARQLDAALPRLLDEAPQTQAEWRERVIYGERCLWGASVIMAAIGLREGQPPTATAEAFTAMLHGQPGEPPRDPLEAAWWHLCGLLRDRRATWPEADLAAFDADRSQRRAQVWREVANKLAQHGLPKPDQAYAAPHQAADDVWPQIKYDIAARYGREKGKLEVRDPFDGTWLEIDYQQATNLWKRLAREDAARRRLEREAQR